MRRLQIAVIGASDATPAQLDQARAVGAAVAAGGATLVCGGLGGVMAAACSGARAGGGLTVGILPGGDPDGANADVDVAVATGVGEARNLAVVSSADAVVAVGGGYGTLSEIALALRAGLTVVGLDTWELARRGQEVDGVEPAADPQQAVAAALAAAEARRRTR